jgi:branched-chain amino acid transport system substrate-binding protein
MIVPLTSGASAAERLTLSKPLTLGFLWQIDGEGANATSDTNDGANIAVAQINAAGGVGGKKISTFRVAFDPLDPQTATTQFLQASGKNPNIIIGLTGPTVSAALPDITHAAIPVLGLFESPQTIFSNQTGSPWLFNVTQTQGSTGAAGAKYLTQKLGYKKIGVMSTNESYGQTTSAGTLAQLHTQGLKAVAYTQYPPTATDLTQQILTIKGSQGVADWAYPNTLAVQLQQFLQSGINIPTVTSEAAQIAVADGLTKGAALNNLYSVAACDPTASNASASLAKFVQSYTAKYHTAPSVLSATAYDAVYFAVAAVKSAGSTSSSALKTAIGKVNFTGGICANQYKSDGGHLLVHENTISKYSSNGSSKNIVTYPAPPVS